MKKTKLIALAILFCASSIAQINPTYIIPNPGTGSEQSEFGTSFAIYEDWMIVAAPGPVTEFLFAYKNVGGIWEFDHVIDNDSSGAGLYGQSMEIEDGILVVGYPREDQEYDEFEGKVHIFELENEQWNFVQEINAPDSTIFCNSDIGGGIQISDGNILVGTQLNLKPYGAVFSYREMGGEWQLHQIIEPPITYGDSIIFGAFGALSTISVDGDQLIIGEIGNTNLGFSTGAVHYYKRIDNYWEFMDTAYEPNNIESTSFGRDVFLNQNEVFVGAANFDTIANGIASNSAGKAYYYQIENEELVLKQVLPNLFPEGTDFFGTSIYSKEDRLFIQSSRAINVQDAGGGHIYLYNKVGELWEYQEELIISSAQNGTFFNSLGHKMIVEGNTFIASAPRNDVDDVWGDGVICVFEDLLVGSDELVEYEFSIQPNPATNEVQVVLPQEFANEFMDLRIFNLNGQLILNEKYRSANKIDISVLSKGLYILEVKNEKWAAQKKLIITK